MIKVPPPQPQSTLTDHVIAHKAYARHYLTMEQPPSAEGQQVEPLPPCAGQLVEHPPSPDTHLAIVHKACAEHHLNDADPAATRAQQVEALLEAAPLRQVEQLGHSTRVSAGLTLLVVPEVNQEALQGLVQRLGVRVSACSKERRGGGRQM
jgi:hypothetical protein